MKVFFSATSFMFEDYKKHYFAIRDHLVDSGHVLTHDWLHKFKESDKALPEKTPRSEYLKVIKGVEQGDVLIFESTLSSFSTGYLLTMGLQQKKPILVMWLESSPWANRKGFMEVIESEFLETTSYNEKNMKQVLDQFLNKYEKYGPRHRFNLVIDDVERQYLEWLSYEKFKTKTALIREMIRKDLGGDESYKKYLSSKRK